MPLIGILAYSNGIFAAFSSHYLLQEVAALFKQNFASIYQVTISSYETFQCYFT